MGGWSGGMGKLVKLEVEVRVINSLLWLDEWLYWIKLGKVLSLNWYFCCLDFGVFWGFL